MYIRDYAGNIIQVSNSNKRNVFWRFYFKVNKLVYSHKKKNISSQLEGEYTPFVEILLCNNLLLLGNSYRPFLKYKILWPIKKIFFRKVNGKKLIN